MVLLERSKMTITFENDSPRGVVIGNREQFPMFGTAAT
jgi:hypothetical protein